MTPSHSKTVGKQNSKTGSGGQQGKRESGNRKWDEIATEALVL